MGKKHLKGDRRVGELGVADLEPDQVAYIVGQCDAALLHLLEETCGRERFGNGSDAEEGLVIDRLLRCEVFDTEMVVIDQLIVLHDGAAHTDGFDFSKICFHLFFKFLFGLLAAGEQQDGHQAGGNQTFFHFSGVLSGLFQLCSGILLQILLQR